jgi:hypothetical protein
MSSLEESKERLNQQTKQVFENTLKINESSAEWEFANKLTTRICGTSKQAAFKAYQRWALLWPALQLFISSESPALAAISSIARLEGSISELITQRELRQKIQVKPPPSPLYGSLRSSSQYFVPRRSSLKRFRRPRTAS